MSTSIFVISIYSCFFTSSCFQKINLSYTSGSICFYHFWSYLIVVGDRVWWKYLNELHANSRALSAFGKALNNKYSGPFVNNVAGNLFTNAGRTTVAADVILVLHADIIDTVMISYTADQTVLVPNNNTILMFV